MNVRIRETDISSLAHVSMRHEKGLYLVLPMLHPAAWDDFPLSDRYSLLLEIYRIDAGCATSEEHGAFVLTEIGQKSCKSGGFAARGTKTCIFYLLIPAIVAQG